MAVNILRYLFIFEYIFYVIFIQIIHINMIKILFFIQEKMFSQLPVYFAQRLKKIVFIESFLNPAPISMSQNLVAP